MKKVFPLLAFVIVLGVAAVAFANPSWWVGIGTSTPAAPLHVAQDNLNVGNSNGQVLIGSASTPTEGLTIGYNDTDHFAWLQSGNYGYAYYHLDLRRSREMSE